jgi:carbon starvation protein
MFKHGKAKWVWVPGIALAWDLITTMTASWQKVFSGNARIGYFEQRSAYRTALDNGELLAPATTTDEMNQIITNSTVNGVLQAVFALLTLTVVLSAIPIWIKADRSGGLPTTELPPVPSRLVAPSDFFATKDEKAAVREYESAQRKLAGSGGRR